MELSAHAHATVFRGPFYRDDIAAYYQVNGLPEPYDQTARRELCDICPLNQLELCKAAWRAPDMTMVEEQARALGAVGEVQLAERAIIVEGLNEPPRYFLQHSHGFQVHDKNKPHRYRRHGRAEIGWTADDMDNGER